MSEGQMIATAATLAFLALNGLGIYLMTRRDKQIDLIDEHIDELGVSLHARVDSFLQMVGGLVTRSEFTDRLKDHDITDNARFEAQNLARHELANKTDARTLDHEKRVTVLETRVSDMRQGRRAGDASV